MPGPRVNPTRMPNIPGTVGKHQNPRAAIAPPLGRNPVPFLNADPKLTQPPMLRRLPLSTSLTQFLSQPPYLDHLDRYDAPPPNRAALYRG